MTTTLTHDPVLTRFRKALGEMYGRKIERVVLFGSLARGDAHASPTMMWQCSCAT